MLERTFSIIKPDATARGLDGEILRRIQEAGLRIIAMKRIHMTKEQAKAFYAVHADKPFFDELTDFICSGPVVCSVLEGDNAIARYRELMGATDPSQAQDNTIRKDLAESKQCNSVHGSDAPETAACEIAYFFSALEITG